MILQVLDNSFAYLYAFVPTCTPSGSMSDLDSSCPFDLLDAAMRDPFLQQAFRQLDQRHQYGIVARVCRSWHRLSTASNSNLTVVVSTGLNKETGDPDAVISFSRWLQRSIGNLTRLDLTLKRPWTEEEEEEGTIDASEMLQTITTATQLRSFRFGLTTVDMSVEPFARLSALTNLTSLGLCSCILTPPAFSSMLALTQLRALDLNFVHVYAPANGANADEGQDEEEEEEEEEFRLPDLTSSLVNLTHLTLYNVRDWGDIEDGLACVRSLKKLVDLDIRGTWIPSGDLINLTRGLPISGLEINLVDAGHVSEVAGWLERCVPCTLRYLDLTIPSYPEPFCELRPSQMVRLLSPLRSAGAQLLVLNMCFFDLCDVDSVSIITGLTQLTKLSLQSCKFNDDGWGLLKPGFAHLRMFGRGRVIPCDDGISSFYAEAAKLNEA